MSRRYAKRGSQKEYWDSLRYRNYKLSPFHGYLNSSNQLNGGYFGGNLIPPSGSPFNPAQLANLQFLLNTAQGQTFQTNGGVSLTTASNQFFNLGSALVTAPPFTFSIFVNPVNRTQSNGLWGLTTSIATTVAVAYAFLDTSGKVNVSFNAGVTSIISATAVANGSWSNVLITYDGTTCNIYINGTLDGNSGALAVSLGTLADTYVGAINSTPGNPASASLDEFQVWTNVLSAGNIAAVSAGLKYNQLSTAQKVGNVVSLDFDNPTTLGKDYSGNGNTFTGNGTPVYVAGSVTGTTLVSGDAVSSIYDQSGMCITSDSRGFFGNGYLTVEQAYENREKEIYQRDGKFGPIKNWWKRPYKGEVVKITARGLKIGLTPKHQVLRVEKDVIKKFRKSKRYGKDLSDREITPTWIMSKDLQVGDYMLVPRPTFKSEDQYLEFGQGKMPRKKELICSAISSGATNEEIVSTLGVRRPSVRQYRRFMELGVEPAKVTITNKTVKFDEEWAELFGWWLAEGSVAETYEKGRVSSITFSLGGNELEEAKRIQYLLKKKAFAGACLQVYDNHIQITVHNIPLAKFLVENFGRGAKNKKIPAWLLESSPECILSFIKAYWAGDGCYCKDKRKNGGGVISFVTIAPGLVSGISLLLMKLGILPRVIKSKNEGKREILGKTCNVQNAWHITVSGHDCQKLVPEAISSSIIQERYITRPEGFYVRISKLNREEYNGFVYDFETESHTLGMPGIIHNSNNGTQTTGSNRYQFLTGQINGQPALQPLNGSTCYYGLASSIPITGVCTIYGVVKLTASAAMALLGGGTFSNASPADFNTTPTVSAVNDAGSNVQASYTGSSGYIAVRFRRDASNVWHAATSGMAEVVIGTLTGTVTIVRLFAQFTGGFSVTTNQFAFVAAILADTVTNGQDGAMRQYLSQVFNLNIP